MEQKDYKSWQGFQIGAKRSQIGAEITNRGKRDYKPGQGLQTGTKQLILTRTFFDVTLADFKQIIDEKCLLKKKQLSLHGIG